MLTLHQVSHHSQRGKINISRYVVLYDEAGVWGVSLLSAAKYVKSRQKGQCLGSFRQGNTFSMAKYKKVKQKG